MTTSLITSPLAAIIPATAPFPGVENENTNNNKVQPMWKVKIAIEAIEALADKVDGKYADNNIAELPNKKLRDTFNKSQKGIAKNLQALAAKGDAGEEYVQNVIVQAIMATGAPSSVAYTIANVLVIL